MPAVSCNQTDQYYGCVTFIKSMLGCHPDRFFDTNIFSNTARHFFGLFNYLFNVLMSPGFSDTHSVRPLFGAAFVGSLW